MCKSVLTGRTRPAYAVLGDSYENSYYETVIESSCPESGRRCDSDYRPCCHRVRKLDKGRTVHVTDDCGASGSHNRSGGGGHDGSGEGCSYR